MRVFHYLDASGKDLYQRWLDKLNDLRARVAIQRRIDRLIDGNIKYWKDHQLRTGAVHGKR